MSNGYLWERAELWSESIPVEKKHSWNQSVPKFIMDCNYYDMTQSYALWSVCLKRWELLLTLDWLVQISSVLTFQPIILI